MQTSVRWSIVMNATDQEWHTFQHGIAAKCADVFFYEFNLGGFKAFTTLADGENEFQVWARRTTAGDLEFAIFPHVWEATS